jgi:hypothetical protein
MGAPPLSVDASHLMLLHAIALSDTVRCAPTVQDADLRSLEPQGPSLGSGTTQGDR